MKSHKTIARNALSAIRHKNANYWQHVELKMRFTLFHEMAARVPAYKDFLKKRKIKPSSIRDANDLQFIPPVTKDNYLRTYNIKELSWDGRLDTPLVYTATSGSTGTPVYFTRNERVDMQSSTVHELFFNNKGFDIHKPTLVIDAFGMGVWIGGLITYQAFWLMQERGYPISIITPGINKEEIFKMLTNVAPQYEQIIIAGYPPFLKDIIDESPKRGINLKKYNLRLLFAAEPFTEKFRTYVAKKVRLGNPLFDTMNIYGSADIGTMAFETPLSILVRQEASENAKLFNDIFSSITKTPTLTQYIPTDISFESDDGKILLSGNNSIPLFKYMIGDHGGVFTYKELDAFYSGNNLSLQKSIRKAGLIDYHYELPFVYVYERMDFSTTIYGLQIYPETIKEVLLNTPYDKHLTGKFTMLTKFDEHHDQYLEINLETQKGARITKSLTNELLADIIKNLRMKNSEFKELSEYLGKRALPTLVFWPTEDPLYFKPGIKQKWVEV